MSSVKSRIEKLEQLQSPKVGAGEMAKAQVLASTFGGQPEGFIKEDGTCIGLEELVCSSMEPESSGGNRNDA